MSNLRTVILKKRNLKISTLILCTILLMSGCAETEKTDNISQLSGLNEQIVEMVLENTEMGDSIDASYIVIDRIFYGSFSQPDAKEALIICKLLNLPHAGGDDRTACILLAVDSMNIVAYQELGADEVVVYSLPMSNGQERILFSGTSTYQGISAQNVLLFAIESGQWVEIPIDDMEKLGEECFYFLADDMLIATSGHELTDLSEVIALLTWDPDTGQFMLEQLVQEYDFLPESYIIGFNGGFFNSNADIMNNMLLTSEYNTPDEIDLFQLFYHGLGGSADQVSAEELTLLTELCSEAPYLDVFKIEIGEMDAFLREKLGIGLEETQKKGLDNFYYLEEYDSYYVVVGDTNYTWCTVLSGIRESDGRIRLDYIKENEDGRWSVTLQEGGNGYLFGSNVRVD